MARRQATAAWLLALPFLALFLVFTAWPVVSSLLMSFTDIRSTDVQTPFAVEFIGLENYAGLLSDPLFHKVALNTAFYVIGGVPLTIVLALAAAVGLNGITRLRGLFRTGYYAPVVTSIVAVAVVWRFLLQDSGLVNWALGLFGVEPVHWLTSTTWALPALVVMAAWRNLGFMMVVFLAGLQTVPQELLEAAEVDGAGRWARFRHVTLPLLRPTLLFGAVITGIGYLQFFEEAFVMTQGGPLDATRSVAYYTYDQFGFGNYGYASAASYVLFVAIVVLSIVQFRILRPKD
jgi:multiple sugar transport system permease protein